MTTFDPELAKDMANEMRMLEPELRQIVRGLQTNVEQPALFAKFAQLVDRIYGTAATLGMKELASYCGTLKFICQECARSTTSRANNKVLKLLETFLENVAGLITGITDPETAKKMNHSLHIEEQKAKKIQEDVFKFVKK